MYRNKPKGNKMKNQNVITKTFAPNGKTYMGTTVVTFGLKSDGRYLVFVSNFEDQWDILRTKNKLDAVNHANKLVDTLTDKGFQLVA